VTPTKTPTDHSRLLPRVWLLTAGEVEKICRRPLDQPADTVLVEDVEGLCRGARLAASALAADEVHQRSAPWR
jgi:hypothetical protein